MNRDWSIGDDEDGCEHRDTEVGNDDTVTWCMNCGDSWPATPFEIERQHKRDRAERRAYFLEKWFFRWAAAPWRRFKAWKAERALRRSIDEEIPF